MIGAISFFIRTLFLTAVVVMFLQIRWGGGTLEDHAMQFVRSSAAVKPIENTAHGMVTFIRNTWSKVTRSINTNFTQALRSENQPGSRQSKLTIERSQEHLKRARAESSDENRDSVSGLAERFKKKSVEISRNVRNKFIDETEVPGARTNAKQIDRSRASATDDDDLIED